MIDFNDYPAVQAQAVKLTVILCELPHEVGLQQIQGFYDRARGNRNPLSVVDQQSRLLLWESTLAWCLETVRAAQARNEQC